MIDKLLEKAGKSFWRELGEEAVKKLVAAVAAESVRASVELWKHERMERLKRRLKKEFDGEDAEEKAKEEASKQEASAEVEGPEVGDKPPKDEGPAEPVVFVFEG
jgi:hypothetical protein